MIRAHLAGEYQQDWFGSNTQHKWRTPDMFVEQYSLFGSC